MMSKNKENQLEELIKDALEKIQKKYNKTLINRAILLSVELHKYNEEKAEEYLTKTKYWMKYYTKRKIY